MKTETKIMLFVLASAGVFWMSLFNYSLYLAMIILLVYGFQLFGATVRTLQFLFSRKRMATGIRNYWIINFVYITGYVLLFALKPYLPGLLDPFVYRFYFATSLIIIAWYITAIYASNKRTHV